MISSFSPLLELFASFGVAIYFLLESDIQDKLSVKSFVRRMADQLISKIGMVSVDSEMRDSLSTEISIPAIQLELEQNETEVKQVGIESDEESSDKVAAKPDEKELDFIKREVAAFRSNFFTISLYCVILLLLSGFELPIGEEEIADIVFNFSVLTIVLCIDRLFSKEDFTQESHSLIGREMLRVIVTFGFSVLVSFGLQPHFPSLLGQMLMVATILSPIYFFIPQFYSKRLMEKFVKEQHKKKIAPSEEQS